MNIMEINKGVAAILVAGIAFFVAGTIGDKLIHVNKPPAPATKTEVAAPAPALAPVTPAPVAPTPAAAPTAALAPIGKLLAGADAAAGEGLSKKLCGACHTFGEGGKNGVGPNLYGTLGRARAAAAGFNFSPALKEKPGKWTYEDMNAWLQRPASFAPGSRMAFPGISSDKQRADVIVYLRGLSKTPEPLPAQ
jgi:cytochrome c